MPSWDVKVATCAPAPPAQALLFHRMIVMADAAASQAAKKKP
jgi:hypothetical protein